MRQKDKELFDLMNNNNENYEITSKQKEIDNGDFRVERPKMMDISSRYNEFKNFQKSAAFRHTQIATELLNDRFSVTDKELSNTLQSKYGLNARECDTVMRNLANSKLVDISINSYDPSKTVRLRRRS